MKTEKKNFYLAALILIAPLALQNLVNVAVVGTDVIMLGRVGEEALSGASLGGQIYYILNLILFGLTSGLSVLTAQYWGKGDVKTIEEILGFALKLSLGISLLFSIVTFIMPETLMKIYSSDLGVIEQGVKYLRIACFGYPLAALSMVYVYTLRSVEKAYVATIMYLVSLIVNIIVNGILIFGLFGIPKLGIVGAAIGTVTARCVEFSIALYYDRCKNTIYKLSRKSFSTKNKLLIKDFWMISSPVIVNEFLWGLGSSMATAVLGQLGPSVSSANSVAVVVKQLAQVVTFGIASATAVMIGKRIGEGKMEEAKIDAKRLRNLSLIFGIVGCSVIMLIRPIVLNFVLISEQSKNILSAMMIISGFIVIAQAYNATMIVGVYRGGGDTKFGVKVDVLTMWCGAIPFGVWAAFGWKAAVPVVFLLLYCDEFLKVPFCAKHFYSYKWLKNITRENVNKED